MALDVNDWVVIGSDLCFAFFECILIVILLYRANKAESVLKPALCGALVHYVVLMFAVNMSTIDSLSQNTGIYKIHAYFITGYSPYDGMSGTRALSSGLTWSAHRGLM
jgi:hypothetical protein